MSDVENKEVAPQEEEAHEYTPLEQEAMDQGWRPKEDFQGEPDRFIDAAEFIRRGELFAKIEHQNKELKQVRTALEQLKQHHAKVEKSTYDRAIKDLQQQRKTALAEGDVELFDKLDNDVDELKEARDQFVEQAKNTPATPEVNPEFAQWVSKNPWYEKDVAMAGAADRIGIQLARQGIPPMEVLKQVEAKIKEEFPHKFSNPNRTKPSAVETPVVRGTPNKSRFVPSEEEKRIGMNFVRAGAFAKIEDYYAELQKMGKE